MDMNAHHASLKQTLKGIESKLAFLGPTPGTHHTTQQAEEFKKLTAVKQNILQQIQGMLINSILYLYIIRVSKRILGICLILAGPCFGFFAFLPALPRFFTDVF